MTGNTGSGNTGSGAGPDADRLRDRVAASLARFERRTVAPDGRRHAAVTMTLLPVGGPADPGSAADRAGADRAPGGSGTTPGGDPADALAFLLTRRTRSLRSHSGQWALPGGRVDPGESVTGAARREVAEEVGLELGEDRVLGLLDDYPTRSGYLITPVVLWAGGAGEPAGNPDEVAELHRVPLREIDREPRFLTIPESSAPVIQVPLFDRFVHAPTGAVLYQFREVVLHDRPTRVAHLEQPVFAWK